jgi:hypothetical protein
MFLPTDHASDGFGTGKIQLAHGIAYHLLRDGRRCSPLGVTRDATLGD